MSTSSHIPNPTEQLRTHRMGLWLYFLSECMIFLVLITTRFYLLGTSRPEGLNQGLGLILTVLLLISSLTAYRAETAIAHGDRNRLLRNLLVTIVLGVVFLLGVVVIEWREAPHMGIVPQSGFGIAFYSMTGMHAIHVLSGVGLLALVYRNARTGSYSAEHHWGVEAGVKYWHFIDLVWVFFYPVLYLL